MRLLSCIGIMGVLSLGACDTYPPTPIADYTIRVMHTQNTHVATPPHCPSWQTDLMNPFDNQQLPQFGCASAQNLAMMIEQPTDLVYGRPLGDARGVGMVGAMRRYDNNQTRGLIWTGSDPNQVASTTAPTSSSPMSGDATSASSSAAPAAQ